MMPYGTELTIDFIRNVYMVPNSSFAFISGIAAGLSFAVYDVPILFAIPAAATTLGVPYIMEKKLLEVFKRDHLDDITDNYQALGDSALDGLAMGSGLGLGTFPIGYFAAQNIADLLLQ